MTASVPPPPSTTPASEEPAQVEESPYYLQAVTELAKTQAVVASEAIYSSTGIKLIDQGARIDGRLYEKLIQHTLKQSIDKNLSTEDAVDAAALYRLGQELLGHETLLQRMDERLGGTQALLEPLKHVQLPLPMAFRLSVMRSQRPELYRHSVYLAIVASFLGQHLQWSLPTCAMVAAAGLLHDVGMLHMDPAWSDKRQKMHGAQRKQLAAHPVTAAVLIRSVETMPREVEQAVLEHHERMDGSGYPRGTPGAHISPMGQVLLLAEVISAFFDKYADENPARQLSLMLRLNHRKFPAELMTVLASVLREAQDRQPSASAVGQAFAERRYLCIGEAFTRWQPVRAQLRALDDGSPEARAFAYIDMRVNGLHRMLAESGTLPDQIPMLMQTLEGDADGHEEMDYVGREAWWQLQNMVDGCLRRWPMLALSEEEVLSAGQDTGPIRTVNRRLLLATWCHWISQNTQTLTASETAAQSSHW